MINDISIHIYIMFRWVFPNKDKEIDETADMI